MKTTEQIKTDVLNYVTKVSKHLYEYNGSYYKIMLDNNDCIVIHGDNLRRINLDTLISYNQQYTKAVLKHILFLNKKVKAIKNHMSATSHINKLMENGK